MLLGGRETPTVGPDKEEKKRKNKEPIKKKKEGKRRNLRRVPGGQTRKGEGKTRRKWELHLHLPWQQKKKERKKRGAKVFVRE